MLFTISTIARTLLVAYCIALAFAAPLSSSLFTEYQYNYDTRISGSEGNSGFRFKARAHLERVYADHEGQLLRLRLSEAQFYDTGSRQLDFDSSRHPQHDLYAHIATLSNGSAIVKGLYTHQSDSTTFKNLKRSVLLNLMPTNHHLISQSSSSIFSDDNNNAQPEMFSPDSMSQVKIVAKQKKQQNEATTMINNNINKDTANTAINLPTLTIFQSVDGFQNVTFRSRVFSQAESNLTTEFHLELVNELQSNAHEPFDEAKSIGGALKLLDGDKYQPDSLQLQRERRVCSTHHCGKSLAQLYQDYKGDMNDDSLASVEASVAFLRIVDRLHDSRGTGVQDIIALLKKMKSGVRSSFLDMLAAARTRDSIMAAMKYLRLAKNDDLDTAERFLSVLSVAAKTSSKMHLRRPLQSPYYFTPEAALKRSALAKEHRSRLASLEFIAQEFLQLLKQTPANKWASHKLRWSSLLTLATLVNANNQEHYFENTGDELNKSVDQLLLKELAECEDTDCRIVALQAMGNVGNLGQDQFNTLRDHVLHSGRRESISAMKVLRDLLQNQAKDRAQSQEFYTTLRDLLFRVVYDNSHETTARVLAAEMIVRFVPNSLMASEELLRHLPSFGNHELATMIYSRMQSLRPDCLAKHHENWFWKSCIINGTSTSFVRTMAKTDSLNASYGVNIELLEKGKILKESSFDVFLDTKQRTQDLFSLGIFARGLSSFGGSDDGTEEDEDTTAGMTLRILGGYLRPYVFFNNKGDLYGKVLGGAGSDPTTAFNGDLLLIDHEEGYPLISGFVAEQHMRGVLSIDVSGHITISVLWSKSAHSVVRTKASVIVQASQSVFTSYDNFWQSHLFSFGGQALVDFVSDARFSSSPFKLCLQVTQPEFFVRYNTRRHEQMMSKEVRRKITRRNYSVGAKSYSLNTENNKMCSLLSDEL